MVLQRDRRAALGRVTHFRRQRQPAVAKVWKNIAKEIGEELHQRGAPLDAPAYALV